MATTDFPSTPDAESVEQLLAVSAVQTVKARYWRMVDTKNWDGLVSEVFAPEFTADFTGTGGSAYDSGQATADSLAEILADVITAHMGGPPEIDIHGDSATAVWPFQDRLQFPFGVMTGSGHYHDTYVKTDAGWRMSSTRITRLYDKFEPTPS